MLDIIWGCDFGPWILDRLPLVRTFGQHYRTVGIGDGKQVIAAVVYYDYYERFKTLQISMASITPRWCSRRTVQAILRYPFVDLGCERVTAHTSSGNTKMIKLFDGVGFKQEGVMRKGFGDQDCLIYGMLRDEAKRWL